MILACEVEPSAFCIPKLFDHAVADTNGGIEPFVIEGQFIQGEQAVNEIRVIVQVAVKPRAVVFEAVQQTIAVPECSQNKIRIRFRNRAVILAAEICGRFSEGSMLE